MKYILTDIEGTTTSISFVHDILFPYSKNKLSSFLAQNQALPFIAQYLNQHSITIKDFYDQLCEWIKIDKKEKILKDLQGLIWEEGYKKGEIKGHVYPDVPDALFLLKSKGINMGVYSSGSIWAQKLLFQYSEFGDLTPYFSHYFDTSVGHKRERSSYENITKQIGLSSSDVLFLSDIEEELTAASHAGLQVKKLIRPPLKKEENQSKFEMILDFNNLIS